MYRYGFIVEGEHDERLVHRMLKCVKTVLLHSKFGAREQDAVSGLLSSCQQVFILTDPDDFGNTLASWVSRVFPQIPRIILDIEQCRGWRKGRAKVGLEHATTEYLYSVFSQLGVEPNFWNVNFELVSWNSLESFSSEPEKLYRHLDRVIGSTPVLLTLSQAQTLAKPVGSSINLVLSPIPYSGFGATYRVNSLEELVLIGLRRGSIFVFDDPVLLSFISQLRRPTGF